MIPYLLAVVGGYLLGDSMKDSEKFARGGVADNSHKKAKKFVELQKLANEQIEKNGQADEKTIEELEKVVDSMNSHEAEIAIEMWTKMSEKMADGGKVKFNDKDLLKKYKEGKSIGFTAIAHLKSKGLIPRADGTKRKTMADGGFIKLPQKIKEDALDNVIKGGSKMDLDKLRNPNKKSYASRSQSVIQEHYDAVIYAATNGLIDKNNRNIEEFGDAKAIVTKDKEGIENIIETNRFSKYIDDGIMKASDAKRIIESAGLEVPKNIEEKI